MDSFINEISKKYQQHIENTIKILSNKYCFNSEEAIQYINNYNNPIDNAIDNAIDCRNDDVYIKVEPQNLQQVSEEKKKRGRPKKPIEETQEKPKKKRGRPKKENKVTIVQDSDDEIEINKQSEKSIEEKIATSVIDDIVNELEEEEIIYEEEPVVELWNYKGDKYFKDNNENIYNLETREKVGIYNKTDDMINSLS